MKKKTPPPIVKEKNWEEVELPFNIGSGRTIYAGLEDDSRLRLRVFKSGRDLVGRAWFGHGADGPPLHAHGGAVAYVLDEAMGAVAWMNEYPALAAKLEFKYSLPTPLETELAVHARITQTTARKLIVEAELTLMSGGSSGQTCVSARGEFARVTRAKRKEFDLESHDPKGILAKMSLKWADEGGNDER